MSLCPSLVNAYMHVTSKLTCPSGYKMIAKVGVTTAIDLVGFVKEDLETIEQYDSVINFDCCNTVASDLLTNLKK